MKKRKKKKKEKEKEKKRNTDSIKLCHVEATCVPNSDRGKSNKERKFGGGFSLSFRSNLKEKR